MKMLIEDWKQGWKFYSTWALAVLAALPDLYNLLAASGFMEAMPEPAVWAVRAGAIMALVSRFVKQKKPEEGKKP